MESKTKFPNIGDKLAGRFRLVFGRGAGPNGVVFKALDLLQDLPVAVKVFKPELFQSDFREQNLYRLYRARTYQDPNIVRIFEVLEDQGFHFITCQLVEGMSLQAIFDLHAESGEYFTIPKIRAVMSKIFDGVESIHRKGAIHGNLKPQNIFILPDRLMLSDPYYLLATQLKEDQEIPVEDYYRAPEQLIDPAKEAPQIDIYALGLIFGEILAGNPVKPEVRLSEQVPRLTSRFDDLFAMATAFRPDQRYESIQEFRKDLTTRLDIVESEGLWKRRYHETGSFRAIKLKATQEEQKIEPVEEEKTLPVTEVAKPTPEELAKAAEVEKFEGVQAAVAAKHEIAEERIPSKKETVAPTSAVVQAQAQPPTEPTVEVARKESALEEAKPVVVSEAKVPEHPIEDKVAIESAVEEVKEEDISKTIRVSVPDEGEKTEAKEAKREAPVDAETLPPEVPEEALEELEVDKVSRETASFEAQAITKHEEEMVKETPEGMQAQAEEIEGIEISAEEVVEEAAEGVEVLTEEVPPTPPVDEPIVRVSTRSEDVPEAKSGVLEMESVAQPVVPPAERMARKPVVMVPKKEVSPIRTFLVLFFVFVVVGGGVVALYALMTGKGEGGKEEGGEPSKQAAVETPKAVVEAKDAVISDKGADVATAQVASLSQPQMKEEEEVVPKKRTLAEIATCPPFMSKVILNSEVAEGSNVPVREVGFCIDTFEYPGKGGVPKGGVSKTTARDICRKEGKRLCTLKEWRLACGELLPYGGSYEEGACNVTGGKLKAAGASEKCASKYGVYDMVGNVSEWVEEGVLAGGDAGTGKHASCSTTSKRFMPGPLNGFRCCADLSL